MDDLPALKERAVSTKAAPAEERYSTIIDKKVKSKQKVIFPEMLLRTPSWEF